LRLRNGNHLKIAKPSPSVIPAGERNPDLAAGVFQTHEAK
jgi:hypothetical protein